MPKLSYDAIPPPNGLGFFLRDDNTWAPAQVAASGIAGPYTRGWAILVAGTATVSCPSVTASSLIFVTRTTAGGTLGFLSAPVASIVAGTSFVINSSNAADTSTVAYFVVNFGNTIPLIGQIVPGPAGNAGTATMVAGTVTVNTTAVLSNSIILISRNTPGGTAAEVGLSTVVAGTSFIILGGGSDTASINWLIIPIGCVFAGTSAAEVAGAITVSNPYIGVGSCVLISRKASGGTAADNKTGAIAAGSAAIAGGGSETSTMNYLVV